MGNSANFKEKWTAFRQSAAEKMAGPRRVCQVIGDVIKTVVSYGVRLRKPVLAAPVLIGAGYLAQYNYEHLPKLVGIDLQTSGEFAQMISRDTAVMAPLVVTGACLLLMFCSRRTIYPWLISVFSLVLPILILITNIFPG